MGKFVYLTTKFGVTSLGSVGEKSVNFSEKNLKSFLEQPFGVVRQKSMRVLAPLAYSATVG